MMARSHWRVGVDGAVLSPKGGRRRALVCRKTWYLLLCQLVLVGNPPRLWSPRPFLCQSVLCVASVTSMSPWQCSLSLTARGHCVAKGTYCHHPACPSPARVGGLVGKIILLLVLWDQLGLTSVTEVTTGKEKIWGACRKETGMLKRFHVSLFSLLIAKGPRETFKIYHKTLVRTGTNLCLRMTRVSLPSRYKARCILVCSRTGWTIPLFNFNMWVGLI